jgi:hypothetical protein
VSFICQHGSSAAEFIRRLRAMKVNGAAELVAQKVDKTLSYYT